MISNDVCNVLSKFWSVELWFGIIKIGHWTSLDWTYFQGWLYRWREKNVKDEDVFWITVEGGGLCDNTFQLAKLDSSDMPTWCRTSVYWCTPVILRNAMQWLFQHKVFDQLTHQQRQQQQQQDNKWLYLPNLDSIAIFTSLTSKKTSWFDWWNSHHSPKAQDT